MSVEFFFSTFQPSLSLRPELLFASRDGPVINTKLGKMFFLAFRPSSSLCLEMLFINKDGPVKLQN